MGKKSVLYKKLCSDLSPADSKSEEKSLVPITPIHLQSIPSMPQSTLTITPEQTSHSVVPFSRVL